ncbi:MAG TPA: lasso RiPP family leader peptide-containing protein [Acidothermaceae bacterium]|jgi:hypothetical protein|nr:lasso RiPP family leader peptide-containing protein [Acidothermaceae bacterium]
MSTYEKPSLTDIGSVHQLTLSGITKTAGAGDVIHIAGQPDIPVPGSSVTSVS